MPLLLLDLDNTLADRDVAFQRWLDAAIGAWAPDDPDAIAELTRLDDDGALPRERFFTIVRQRFDLCASVDGLIADYRARTLEAFDPLASEIAQGLRAARRRGWMIAVVTNGDAEAQQATIERIGLLPLIDAAVVSGAVGVRKPDPAIFRIAAERCGAELGDAWMIGDGAADIEGAAAAGIPSVWLTRGRSWQRSDLAPTLTARTAAHAIATVTAGPHPGSP